MTTNEQAAYDYAVANGMTPQQVLDANYGQVATACGVTVKPDGSSPGDFHYEKIKLRVALELKATNRDTESDNRKAELIAKMKELLDWAGVKVTRVYKGEDYTAPVDGFFVRRA